MPSYFSETLSVCIISQHSHKSWPASFPSHTDGVRGEKIPHTSKNNPTQVCDWLKDNAGCGSVSAIQLFYPSSLTYEME